MRNVLSKTDITSGYRQIYDGSRYNHLFASPNDTDKIIIEDGEVDETVDLMKRVVWKYIKDTKKISMILMGDSLKETCQNIWRFLYNHIQYKLDKKGLEQLRRPNRSWAERRTGIDCDCFSIFVSSILTNLHIPHSFRITKYDQDIFQHVYVIVPKQGGQGYYTIDCVLSRFDYEKPFTEKKDFNMNLNGINVAVLSGTDAGNVMDLVSGVEGLGQTNESERLQALYEHLVKTRRMIAEKPEIISNVDYPPAFLRMLDYAIENWNTPNRDKALEILAKNEDALNLRNGVSGIDDPEMDGLDNDWSELDNLSDIEIQDTLLGKIKLRAKSKDKPVAKKGFFKKVGEAAKKGGKAFVRINPVMITARSGFLLALKLNLKKMGSRLKWGYASKEQAAAKGVSAADWQKSKDALTRVEKLFADKLQGTRKAMRNAILKGKAGGINGVDEEMNGMGIVVTAASSAAVAAALPIISAALKMMVDAGAMRKEEAEGIEAEIKAKSGDIEAASNDPQIQSDAAESIDTESTTSSEGGIVGFVKKRPLIAIGGAALGIWGLSKVFNKKKSKKGNEINGVSLKEKARHRKREKRKINSITLK